MITAKQLEERVNYIGASDVSGLLGLSRWATPLKVWAEKTGQIPTGDRDAFHLMIGNRLEDLVGELFSERKGIKIKRVPDTIYHESHPFMAANLDFVTEDDTAVVEAKTAASWKAAEWKDDETPTEYIIQVLWQMAVTGKRKGYIACLIGNQSLEIREVLRDEKLIREIMGKVHDFWHTYVIPKVMPWTITKRDDDTLYKLFPLADEGKVLTLNDDAEKICESLDGLRADKSNIEDIIEQQENELKAMLKDAETGLTNNRRITWKNKVSRRLDAKRFKAEKPLVYSKFVKESPSRSLKITNREEIQ